MRGIWRTLAAAALAAGTALPALAQEEPIRVGVLLPLSGGSSIAGQEVFMGATLALEERNAAGGVLGRQVEMVAEDDESSPTMATTAVRKLIESDGVPAIVGTYNSNVALAAMRAAREYEVPMSSGGSTAITVTDENEPGDPWFFRAFPGSDEQGRQSALDVVEALEKKRLAVVHDNSSYGTSLADQFAAVTTEAGAEIIAREAYNSGEQDFYSMLMRLRSLEPEAIYLGGLVGEGASIVRQAAEVGLQTQFVGSGSMMTDQFIELTGPASEGFAVSSMFEPDTPNEHGRAFAERFQERWNVPANVHSALGYDSMAIVLEAIERAGEPDGRKVRDAMMEMDDFLLVQGPPGTTADYNEQGGVNFKIGLAVVRDGRRSLVGF